ncbi:hypothetical protein CYI61_05720 [Campylobacter upsaliensis]|uniref:Uncharacterized protein n=2 Tax=Campylobacter upsaliensis TaxID=28080 RepID=A0A828QVL6_CAMUP|nr:hypothetical protein [Campylobacter upsaliensis]EAI4101349.1 hypothetical protein [Campylobacter jejuni]EAH5676780.1 hypothetical protein [Campylobacter upsaliensis]EAH5886630.1 hypothetical protein [Campylobacter upsaliensis]EAI4357856.1 hypothetical protein [Campylobacter upsaliensis]EAI4457024.1 hypothetical protein [Campylobacter upsaliensis]
MKKSFYQEFKDKTKQSLTRLRLEKRGIYNVSFNEKNSTPINAELEAIENAIIDYVVHYVKGWHNERRDKGRGAEHIKLHLEKGSEGEISLEELLNLGNSIREYLKIFKEPFDDGRGGKVFEWENDEGVRFRIATDKIKGEGLIPPLSPSDEIIITFYSDRNLNEKMEFKNPKVKEFYENKEKSKNSQNISKLGLKK